MRVTPVYITLTTYISQLLFSLNHRTRMEHGTPQREDMGGTGLNQDGGLAWNPDSSNDHPLNLQGENPWTCQRIGFLIYKTIWFNTLLVELPQFDYCNKQELNVNLNLNLWEPASGKLLIWPLVALVGDACCMMTTNMPSSARVDLDIYLHFLSVIPSSSICWGHCC